MEVSVKNIILMSFILICSFSVYAKDRECTPMCDQKECGNDGCGSECGKCTGGKVCSQDGLCVENKCGNITFEGCCENGLLLKYCEYGEIKEMSCKDEFYPFCGWSEDAGFYNCNTKGGKDPSNGFPYSCSGACTKNCSQKECGSDGCGGTCGECPDDKFCNWDGNCTESDCGDVSYEGCCDTGGTLQYCENNKLKQIECEKEGMPYCGWNKDKEYYDCDTDGLEDPSGDSPYPCVTPCTPVCEGKDCGPDGCGKSCGECGQGTVCIEGKCVESQCGDIKSEGCCTEDGKLKYCTKQGSVEIIDCVELGYPFCGWNTEFKYYDCDTDGTGDPDNGFLYACTFPCGANCVDKQCGPDGCGGSCGKCKDTEICSPLGECVEGECGQLGGTGCCDGEVLKYCEKGQIIAADCKDAELLHCGWNKDMKAYTCGMEAKEDPSSVNKITCPAAPVEGSDTAVSDDQGKDAAQSETVSEEVPDSGEKKGSGGCALSIPGSDLAMVLSNIVVLLIFLLRRKKLH
jgi:hypothetical protein